MLGARVFPCGGAVRFTASARQPIAVDRDDAESFGAAFAVGPRIITAYRAGQRFSAAVHQVGVGDLDPPVNRPGAGLVVGFAEPHIQTFGRGLEAAHRIRIVPLDAGVDGLVSFCSESVPNRVAALAISASTRASRSGSSIN